MKRNKNIIIFLNFFKRTPGGFTLIELLIVIGIISLLSAVILINLSGARERASIAKSLEISHTINNTIGAYAVGIWGFNEGAGNSVADTSNYNNNGTWSGSADWVANTVTQLGWAGQFNNSAFINIGDPGSGILDFGIGDFSLSAWFYLPSLPGMWKSIISKGASGSVGYGMEISSNNQITCSIQGVGGSNQHVSGSVPKIGVWHYAVCVFNRDDKVFVYLDGKENTNASVTGNAGSISNAVPFRVGAYGPATWRFVGQIDDVHVFTSVLTAGEIQKNYTGGEVRYKNFTKK
jgi:prepilin-type N-terminal cleavage/methylation domain-containing protein